MTETTETKRRGRPPLDLPRTCTDCGAAVVRPGVLRPVPRCARCYHRARRRAEGRKPREPSVLDRGLALLDDLISALGRDEANAELVDDWNGATRASDHADALRVARNLLATLRGR